jgi:hypothetical protein
MCSGRGDGPLHPPGFPIRKSPDRSLVADSPGLIAGSYVLHRLLVPRHPPCALNNLATTDVMLASTVQFSRYGRSRRSSPSQGGANRSWLKATTNGRSLRTQQRARPGQAPGASVPPASGCTNWPGRLPRPNNQCSTNELPPRNTRPGYGSGRQQCQHCERQVLLRKEVIQPHLPVRLPCYDFVPIAGPTFDGSLPYGLGHRLRVLPTFVT